MQFDKPFAIGRLTALIAQHPDVIGGNVDVLDYLASAPFAGGMARYYTIDTTLLVKGLISFDFEWGQKFQQLNKRPPQGADWEASFLDRANAFADALGALKPYDNPKKELRSEYVNAPAQPIHIFGTNILDTPRKV